MNDTCLWCGKTEDEHLPPGQHDFVGKYGATAEDRLCPVEGVSSQFFTSREDFRELMKPFWNRQSTFEAVCDYIDRKGWPSRAAAPDWLIQFGKELGQASEISRQTTKEKR